MLGVTDGKMQSLSSMEEELEGGLELLEANLAELQNSVYHLVRSNVELAQFLQESPGDPDLEQALEENKGVLVKKRHRVKSLQRAIADLKTYRPHLAPLPPSNITPVSDETPQRTMSAEVAVAGTAVLIADDVTAVPAGRGGGSGGGAEVDRLRDITAGTGSLRLRDSNEVQDPHRPHRGDSGSDDALAGVGGAGVML